MTASVKTVIYPVRDLDRATAMVTALLGTELAQDAPYYVGYQANGQDIGLDPNGHAQGMTEAVPYLHVDDLNTTLRALVAAGAEPQGGPRDVGGGR